MAPCQSFRYLISHVLIQHEIYLEGVVSRFLAVTATVTVSVDRSLRWRITPEGWEDNGSVSKTLFGAANVAKEVRYLGT